MPDFVTLTCPSCGGKLKITNDIDRFACMHCGAEHIVRRGEGIIALAPVVEGLAKVQVGVDKTASELAIQRLSADITRLSAQIATAKTDVTNCASSIATNNDQIAQLRANLIDLEKGPRNLENRLAQIVKPKPTFLVVPIIGSLFGIGIFDIILQSDFVFIGSLFLPVGIIGIAIFVSLLDYFQYIGKKQQVTELVFKEHMVTVQQAKISTEQDIQRIQTQIINSENLQNTAQQEIQQLEKTMTQKQTELQHHQEIVAHR